MAEERIRGRKQRIQLLRKMLNEMSDKSLTELLAHFCVLTGVTEYTACKYLKLLREADLIPSRLAFED
jgi:hypothetical protein